VEVDQGGLGVEDWESGLQHVNSKREGPIGSSGSLFVSVWSVVFVVTLALVEFLMYTTPSTMLTHYSHLSGTHAKPQAQSPRIRVRAHVVASAAVMCVFV